MKVLLAIPTGGHFHYKLVPRIVEMCKSTVHEVELFINYMIGNEANRNSITKYFLKGDYDYLLMIDTDQVPNCNPLDMIKHDKDICSVPTILYSDKFYWNAFDKNEDGDNKELPVKARLLRGEGLEKVYATSTGCLLIKRKVLEDIPTPFVPERDSSDKRLITQDILFCMKAAEQGFEVWIDWDKTCAHYKEINILSI